VTFIAGLLLPDIAWQETFLPCSISQRNALVNRYFWALIVFSHRQTFRLATNTLCFPASELSTHNYTDGSQTASSLSNILNPRSITEIIDLQQILKRPRLRLPPVAEYVRVRLPVIATGQPYNPAPFNSNLSTPPALPITR
jgi:hypothetical protein